MHGGVHRHASPPRSWLRAYPRPTTSLRKCRKILFWISFVCLQSSSTCQWITKWSTVRGAPVQAYLHKLRYWCVLFFWWASEIEFALTRAFVLAPFEHLPFLVWPLRHTQHLGSLSMHIEMRTIHDRSCFWARDANVTHTHTYTRTHTHRHTCAHTDDIFVGMMSSLSFHLLYHILPLSCVLVSCFQLCDL